VLYTYPRYYVDVRMSFADYLARFSSKSRWTLNHKVRKFKTTSGGTIDWSTFRTPEEMDRFLAEALPLSERTYQHRLFGTGLSRSDAFRKKLAGLAHENRVRGWLLRLQGQPIAYLCAPASVGRVLTYDYVGFDAAYGALSPGTVLQYLVLQQLCEERAFDYFDFTEGDGDHKAFFATHTLYCADVLVRGSAFTPRAWLTCHRAFAVAARLTLEAADKAGVRRRLKKLIAANVDAKRVEDSGHSLPHLERPKDGGSTASVGRVHPMTSAIVEQATASEMRASAWYDG
jgi:CelD/BcsL family acetyltransferase involved in cellulose biosynthesis